MDPYQETEIWCKEITSLKSDGITYTEASDKANILNSQFKSVFTKLVPLKLKHLAELVLPRKLKPPTMPNISITINGVSKQLSKLNPGKAAGPDNRPLVFWKNSTTK